MDGCLFVCLFVWLFGWLQHMVARGRIWINRMKNLGHVRDEEGQNEGMGGGGVGVIEIGRSVV